MAGSFTAVDLTQLAPPDIVQEIDFEQVLAAMLADLRARDPDFDALVESDPAFKLLEVAAWRETLLRQRINEAAQAVMLAYAAGPDLDQIGANYSVARLVLDPGDPDALPPVPPTLESDSDFRRRIQLSPEGLTTAGSRGSYEFHALGADPDVLDAQAVSPAAGEVTVYVLSRSGDGTASTDLVEAVQAVLSGDTIRPMTDQVTVTSVAITTYTIEAALTLFPGPDAEVVRQSALAEAQAYAARQHRLGYDVTLSGIYAALHQPGVQNVALTSPAADIVMGDGQAAFVSAVTVTVGGTDV
ncbi:baseplate assembly protein [Roseovarius ramblicola]|uniref:Baseplate J/gp47 family protein n=1 Tax=Roseovarius ramblicola TaxID=2022336 RepID=A0ABV5HYL7_9RHOB